MNPRLPIVVEQLNHSQWHAVVPDRAGRSVGSYVAALSDALICGALDDRPVQTIALDGTALLMANQYGEIPHG